MKFFILIGLWVGICGIVILLWMVRDVPDVTKITALTRQPSIVIKDQDGQLLATYGDLFGRVRQLRELPVYTKNALLAVEDKRFYSHFGLDVFGIARAVVANRKAGRVVQGGSSITQQLAKNILIATGKFKHNDQTYKRKIQEVFLVLQLERKFTKDQILTLYLNRVYFGSGTYGIDAAAQKYFGKSAPTLTLFESAIIVGLLKSPSKFSPHSSFKRATDRAETVIKLMQSSGFIKDASLEIAAGHEQMKDFKAPDYGVRYFTDWIRDSIQFYADQEEDLEVITTLDITMQKAAEKSVKQVMDEYSAPMKVSEAAFVAMSPDGAVKAMVGGRAHGFSQFNRVTQALRQPGSAIKTFVYLAALEYLGKSMTDLENDAPYEKGTWHPSNFKHKAEGDITYLRALQKSVNSVTIRTAEKVGVKRVKQMLEKVGIYSDMPDNLTIALGSGSITLLDYTAAYACFANHGRLTNPHGILAINDKFGNPKYRFVKYEKPRVMTAKSYHELRHALNTVVTEGTGRRTNIDGTVSGKTGSNGHRDAWFIGYRETKEGRNNSGFTDVVVGAWVGNDNNSDMHPKSMGSFLPAIITKTFLLSNTASVSSNPAPKPAA
ncbi:MAG: transglycosylase domain-containing protein [Pseudomonadota bacterium]